MHTCGADDHIPDIECMIRTIKDRARCGMKCLLYKYFPKIILIHLVKNCVFWLNALVKNNNASRLHSPRYIMTSRQISCDKYALLEFGEYVQTHEKYDNSMTEQTMGCINLGPTGNAEGSHYFMSLASGKHVVRSRWTAMPMPIEVIHRVNELEKNDRSTSTIVFADQHGLDVPGTSMPDTDNMNTKIPTVTPRTPPTIKAMTSTMTTAILNNT